MADQIRGDVARTTNRQRSSNDIHAAAGVAFPRNSTGNFSFDDVIAFLANLPENQRARQVGEWERLRRQTIRRAA